jgi:methionine-rich copper-binding protein CopC
MPAGSPGLLRLALGLLLAAVSSLALSAPATAHSYLNNSNPNDGETLKVAPDRVTLTFSDSVRDTGLGVTAQGPQGGFLLDATAMTKKVIAVWPDESDPGKYTVSYRAVSIDGHVMDGSIAFEIAAAAGSPSPASAGSTKPKKTTENRNTIRA